VNVGETSASPARQRLAGLQALSYEHPFDRRALGSLQGTPGLETLVRKCNEYGIERLLRIQYTGSNIRVTPDSFPNIHALVTQACATLDCVKVPDVYVETTYGVNAFTAGSEQPILVLSSGCVDLLTDDELLFVIAHEIGHIKSQHVLYHQIGMLLPVLGEVVGVLTLGLSGVVSTGLQVALLNWQRMSEFTADRAGLLGCQDVNAAISAMVKVAGLPHKYYDTYNTEDFIAQARAFKGYDFDTLDRVAKVISIMGQNHPWTVMRAAEFVNWIDAGDYDRILQNPAPLPPTAALATTFCTNCGSKLPPACGFCPQCGARVQGVAC
jgi:Zn-dependent protease with chaperone function